MLKEIQTYHNSYTAGDKKIFDLLYREISSGLPNAENKIWHSHPVWFLEGNPVTGYSKQKKGVRLMFWSGMSFEEESLLPGTGKFKDASFFYNSVEEINVHDLARWIEKSRTIQWDYK
ncbi:MAG: DUF1801 domain-containing protein, partial [Balneolales bacterium]|nr:DUF1801 domain-containing protein [Balneolales bacterium]